MPAQLKFNGSKVELVNVDLPPPGPGEMRLRTEWTQVSIGTEIAWIDAHAGKNQPAELGYSAVGVVEALGPGAAGFQVGQRVMVSAPHARQIAYHIVERAAPKLLEATVVVGQGVVGSLVLQIARLTGAEPLIAVDTDARRLEIAKAAGATHTINAASEDLVARVKEITGGKGAALCIEAATNAKAYQTCCELLALRGRLVVSSTVYEPVPVYILRDFIEREITMLGAHQPKVPVEPNPYHPYTQAQNRSATLHAIRDGRLKVDHLMTHRVKPADAPALYERLRQKDRSIVGAFINWSE
jgi:threonine dehydrogenase-like Zn-dependent dehydrogenase